MQGGGNILASLFPLIILFAIFYFLIIRPQQKQAKTHKEMLESLKKGDKIITNGGLICEVIKAQDDYIKAQISDNTVVRISKDYIAKKID